MFTRLDKPIEIEIEIEDKDNIDREYLTFNKACKYLNMSNTGTKFTLDMFLTCYLYEGKKYFKKDDIVYLSNLRDKLEKTITLCPILGLKDPKGVKNFLEKKNIRFLPYGEHPFGKGHLYYKEDLESIKNMYKEFRDEVKLQNSNLHKLSIKSSVKNKQCNSGKKIKVLQSAIEITPCELEDYFTLEETTTLLNKEDFNVVSLDKFLTPYHYNYELYYKKSDAINLSNKFKNITQVKTVAKTFGYSSSNFLDLLRNSIKINLINPGEHPYGKRVLMYINDIDKIKSYLSIESKLNLDNYISYQEVINLFGVKTPSSSINKFALPAKYKGILYYKKEDIAILHSYLNDTVTLLSLEKKYNNLIGSHALRTLLLNNGIELIMPENHPFNSGILIYKDNLDEIDNLVNINYEVDIAKSRYEKFRILTSQIPLKESIKETLNDFSSDFIYKRLKDNKEPSLYISLYESYKLLCSILKKNLYEYSRDDVERFIKMIFSNKKITGKTKVEFINFCNFSDRKYNSYSNSPYAINRDKMYKNHRDTSSYSKEQFLQLFGLLYCSIDDSKYLSKALNNRNYAMIWLYMYLHFVVFWRTSTIQDIPFPNLNIIGFDSGESFIEWCNQPQNVFTTDMGLKICASVKIQIDSLRITASKNNQPLVFEYGKLMSRGLGFLLALCEAHRQIADKALKTPENKDKYIFGISKDTQHLITSNFRNIEHFIGLFGEKYTNILGNEIFSNLKAEKSFNNYTLDFSDENNNAIGSQILSIMRGHVVNVQGLSNTTTTYETRLEEGTIGEIESTLQEIGAFGFAKHALLNLCNSEFALSSKEDKKQNIIDLSMSPMQIETVVKSISLQQQTVLNYLTKIILNPNMAKDVLRELTFGNVAGKHHHSRCLLKAIINANLDNIEETELVNLITDLDFSKTCLMPDCESCFSCPLLIGEMYLLYELNEVICDCIKNISYSENNFECYIHSSLLFTSYLPILYTAQDVLGEDIINTHININYICSMLEELESSGHILLDLPDCHMEV